MRGRSHSLNGVCLFPVGNDGRAAMGQKTGQKIRKDYFHHARTSKH
jgi:hypothetical protein